MKTTKKFLSTVTFSIVFAASAHSMGDDLNSEEGNTNPRSVISCDGDINVKVFGDENGQMSVKDAARFYKHMSPFVKHQKRP